MFKVVVIDTLYMKIESVEEYDTFLDARIAVFEKFHKREIRLILDARTAEIVALYERINDSIKFYEVNET